MAEALRDRLEPGRLGLVPERVVRVGPVDDFREENQGRVAIELVLLHQGIEGAFPAVVAEIDAWHVERDGILTGGCVDHLLRPHEQKLGSGIDELPDQPRAGDAIYFYSFACDPLHGETSAASGDVLEPP